VDPEDGPIRIAGAGPAGLACAIAIGRAGRRVVVSEARGTVGARFIGGFQIFESYSREEDARDMLVREGIAPDFLGLGLTEAELFDSRLRRTRVASERPFAYFLRRGPEEGTLDESLLRQARAAGAEVEFHRRREPQEVDVVATGPRVPDGLAREMTFRTSSPDRVQVLFDSMRAPGGYAYFFVQSGRATLGCAVVRELKRIDRHFEFCVKRFREIGDFSVSEERTGYSYMNFTVGDSALLGSTRVAGEAGGFQDYLFGLGIRYAMETGWLAARSLLEGRSYDELWEEKVGARRRSALGLRLLYESLGDAGLSYFARRGGRSDFRDFLARWSRAGFFKETLSVLARAVWPRPATCPHGLPDHWCRGRETRGLPPQGPEKIASGAPPQGPRER
jgi:flavin-dependent dehydrogenase